MKRNKEGERYKTAEELAQETDSELVMCDAMSCGSFAKFYTKDGQFLCATHLALKYKISHKTDKEVELIVRS